MITFIAIFITNTIIWILVGLCIYIPYMFIREATRFGLHSMGFRVYTREELNKSKEVKEPLPEKINSEPELISQKQTITIKIDGDSKEEVDDRLKGILASLRKTG